MTEETGALLPNVETARPKSKKKITAVVLVVLLLVSSMGVFVWYQYYRHWTVEDLKKAVINDPGPGAPGFKHSLAGKNVVVEGKITNITTKETTLENLTLIELDGDGEMPLMAWGESEYEVGKKLEMKVRFEWSSYNEERHVYSPQVAFPSIWAVLPMEIVLRSVNYVAGGADLSVVQVSNGNVRVSVDWVQDPIPLSTANCSLRAGKSSWAVDYVDILGFYEHNNETDYVRNMTVSNGANDIIHFNDVNSDGYLDRSDYLDLITLPKPTAESGIQTYLLFIQWPRNAEWHWMAEARAVAFIVMTPEGPLHYLYADSPSARLARSSTDNGSAFTFQCVDRTVEWSDLSIILSASSNSISNFTELHPLTSDLAGGGAIAKDYDSLSVGLTMVRCRVDDRTGDGKLGNEDAITVASSNGTTFDNDTVYSIEVLCEKTSARICSAQLHYNVTPQSNISLSHVIDGIALGFTPPYLGYNETYEYFETPWSEVKLVLDDGLNTTTWQPDSISLATGSAAKAVLASQSMGTLTVFCNITDLDGNGYINRGDTVVFTTGGAEKFSSSVSYNVTIMFNPTDGEIATTTSHG